MFGFDVIGVDLIEKKLKAMEPKLAKKLVRQSLRKAAKPVLKASKENVPVDSGDLKKSLKVRTAKSKKGEYALQVSTSDKGHWYKGDQFYGAFIEFGTKNIEAKPFLRPAYDSKKDIARKILLNELMQGIKEASR